MIACLVHGLGVVGDDGGAGGPQGLGKHDCGRFPHVVGVRLEGQAPERKALAGEVLAEVLRDLPEHQKLLIGVHVLDGLEDLEVVIVLVRRVDDRLDVLRKARAAVADA